MNYVDRWGLQEEDGEADGFLQEEVGSSDSLLVDYGLEDEIELMQNEIDSFKAHIGSLKVDILDLELEKSKKIKEYWNVAAEVDSIEEEIRELSVIAPSLAMVIGKASIGEIDYESIYDVVDEVYLQDYFYKKNNMSIISSKIEKIDGDILLKESEIQATEYLIRQYQYNIDAKKEQLTINV